MEDSQAKTQELQTEAQIQEVMRVAEAQKIELHSEALKNPVLHSGDVTLEAPVLVKQISSAGHVFVWDTRTFEKIPILYYMLPSKLRLRRPDGSFRFTVTDPKQLPKQGTLKCLLHKDAPNRAHYDELGFRVCPKENLTNPHQVTQHMKKKHSQEWAAIEDERTRKEREEDRAFQRYITARTLESLQREAPIEVPKPAAPKDKPLFICDVCKVPFGAKVILERHMKEHEPKQDNL